MDHSHHTSFPNIYSWLRDALELDSLMELATPFTLRLNSPATDFSIDREPTAGNMHLLQQRCVGNDTTESMQYPRLKGRLKT